MGGTSLKGGQKMLKNKNLSLSSCSLQHKLKIAFYLTSILPWLVSVYFISNYILPYLGFKLHLVVSALISIFIALTGFYVIKEIFDRILSVSTEAKLIVAGDLSRKIEIGREDEIGDLGEALNQLTQRIRNNMEELKRYSERSTAINLEIHKLVLGLSNLLQISSLIAYGDKLESILKLIIEKSRLLDNFDAAYLFVKEQNADAFSAKMVDGINSEHILKVKIDHNDKIFNKLLVKNQPLIIDKENMLSGDLKTIFYEKFKLNNTLALPIYLRGKLAGIFGVGSQKEDALYKKEDIEVMDIFAKQIAIALENDMLIQRIGKLEIKDSLTGLYNETFIRNRLQEEIKRAIAYRRPCAFILFDIDDFQKFSNNFGREESETVLKNIGFLIRDSCTEIDRVARTADDEFAIVLPEKNKRQAQAIAEDIRKKVESSFKGEQNINKRLTVSAGVSENPLDGVEAQELIAKAKESLSLAKKQGKNRIGIVPHKHI